MIRYPNIIGKTDSQKLDQMKSYLHQLADELNFQLDKTGNLTSGYPSSTVDAAAVAKPIKKDDAISNFNDIKALIIKSADIVDAYYEEINKKLEGQYVAESDFGTYKETTQAQLNASSDRIDVVVEKQEEIDTGMDNLERTLRSEIEQTAESIKLEVTGGEPGKTASIKLTVGDNSYSGTIDMTGLVTFTKLETAGQTTINGSNITTGEILADLVKAGVIKSKDGESVVIDLDTGTVDVTGNITTQKEQSDVGLRWAKVSPGGLHAEGEWGSIKSTADVQPGYVELNGNNSNVILQPDLYGDGQAYMSIYSNGNSLGAYVTADRSMITGLTAPITPSDAVNKGYVDGPPLYYNVPYLTTKRWNGQAVYQKLIDCGTMPNGSESAYGRKVVSCGISPDKVVNITGYIKTSTEFNPLYQGYGGGFAAYFFITSNGIAVNAMRNLGNEGYTCAVLIEYVE
jgi:hypothetical protein